MAAPTHTAITTKASIGGVHIPRGFSSVFVFNRLPTAVFYTQSIKPGKTMGVKISQSTMLNLTVKTNLPGKLIEHDDVTVTATYDPTLKSQIISTLMQQNGSCTQYWPDGTYEDFYGFMYEADWAELKIDELPLVTFKIAYSNWDPANNIEVAPVLVNVTGT